MFAILFEAPSNRNSRGNPSFCWLGAGGGKGHKNCEQTFCEQTGVSYYPQAVSRLSQLFMLKLFTNVFAGSIPQTISSLRGMASLLLNTNKLQGPIPDGMSST